MPGMLEGRVAVVTGAGRGIGASVTRLLAKEAHQVVVDQHLGVALDATAAGRRPHSRSSRRSSPLEDATGNGDDVADYRAAEALVTQAIDTYREAGRPRQRRWHPS